MCFRELDTGACRPTIVPRIKCSPLPAPTTQRLPITARMFERSRRQAVRASSGTGPSATKRYLLGSRTFLKQKPRLSMPHPELLESVCYTFPVFASDTGREATLLCNQQAVPSRPILLHEGLHSLRVGDDNHPQVVSVSTPTCTTCRLARVDHKWSASTPSTIRLRCVQHATRHLQVSGIRSSLACQD